MQTAGIHHVTAMSSDAQGNRDFYEGVLGLRMVKQTVNFDEPGTYHLYYGDGLGSPGTILTFFPIPGLPPGRDGAGVTELVALAIPEGAAAAWRSRLDRLGVAFTEIGVGGVRPGLALADPDGMRIELVETGEVVVPRQWDAWVPAGMAIQGVEGVTLASHHIADTHQALASWLGLESDAEGVFRGHQALGGRVRVRDAGGESVARLGAGTVHHIAFRSTDAGEQLQWLDHVRRAGGAPTPVQDREYFTSIYFREPGGVLLEIATDPPGFTRDEPADALGSSLRLPAWLAAHRVRLLERLPALETPRQESLR
jgi:glyoxalase family protein